jgi:hypothetical protein
MESAYLNGLPVLLTVPFAVPRGLPRTGDRSLLASHERLGNRPLASPLAGCSQRRPPDDTPEKGDFAVPWPPGRTPGSRGLRTARLPACLIRALRPVAG